MRWHQGINERIADEQPTAGKRRSGVQSLSLHQPRSLFPQEAMSSLSGLCWAGTTAKEHSLDLTYFLERGRETLMYQRNIHWFLLTCPHLGTWATMPWLGIEPVTFLFAGWHSVH